jgi:hypothetical protein
MPATPPTTLAAAIRSGDADTVRQLLASEPDLRARLDEPWGDFGGTALIAAVGRDARSDWWAGSFGVLDSCDPALALYLVERGATLDVHAAARSRARGYDDVLQLLIERSPDTVLLIDACEGGDVALVAHTLAAHPDVVARLRYRGAGARCRRGHRARGCERCESGSQGGACVRHMRERRREQA